MKAIFVRSVIRITAFTIFSLLTGVVSGRWLSKFIESEIEYDSFCRAVVLIGKPLGLKVITDLDSYLDTILIVTQFLILPWALLVGVCGMLFIDGLLRFLRAR